MIIIGGHRSYSRKTVLPGEIGINTSENIKQFELTQRYAHLWFIPLFPLKFSWCVRLKDNKLYEVTEHVKVQLEEVPYSKASLLIAFAGPIAGLLAWTYFNWFA